MGDLRPLGSEKLQGIDKLKRIMEIANYNEVPRQDVNELSTTNYTIQLPDGNYYGIVKEKSGYIIKKGLDESTLDYSEPMRNRRYFRSYSEAMKKLNLVVSEVNRTTGNEFEVPLIGEQSSQKKKFILKTPKPPVETTPEDVAPLPSPAPAPAPSPAPAPPSEEPLGMDNAEGMDLPTGMEDPMGMDMPDGGMEPESEEMGMGTEEMGMDTEDEDEGASTLKMVQKLTGKLSQKIRSLDKDKGMDSQDIKYVVNSILSAMDLNNLDDDDREEIVDKIEGTDEYGTEGEGDLDISGEEDFTMDDEGDEMDIDMDMDIEGLPEEPKEGYQNVMDSIFSESRVDEVLSGYFDIKDEEKPILENKSKMEFLQGKLQKIQQKADLVNFSITERQEKAGLNLLESKQNATFIGKTNKKNLVFNVDGKQVKVTPNGRII